MGAVTTNPAAGATHKLPMPAPLLAASGIEKSYRRGGW
jgi:hypothetical protein